jgi:hypothetical protein
MIRSKYFTLDGRIYSGCRSYWCFALVRVRDFDSSKLANTPGGALIIGKPIANSVDHIFRLGIATTAKIKMIIKTIKIKIIIIKRTKLKIIIIPILLLIIIIPIKITIISKMIMIKII